MPSGQQWRQVHVEGYGPSVWTKVRAQTQTQPNRRAGLPATKLVRLDVTGHDSAGGDQRAFSDHAALQGALAPIEAPRRFAWASAPSQPCPGMAVVPEDGGWTDQDVVADRHTGVDGDVLLDLDPTPDADAAST